MGTAINQRQEKTRLTVLGAIRLGAWQWLICLVMLLMPALTWADTDWVSKATEAFHAKDYEGTIRFLKKALEENPNPVLLNNLGKTYEKVGRYDLAYQSYKRVVDDPQASAKLRALDQERMERIQPKLSQTMVLVDKAVRWQSVWVNGRAYPMGSGIELAVPSGELAVDIFKTDDRVLIRMNKEGLSGRRLTLNEKLTLGLDKRFGVMSWERAKRKLKAITIDDVPLQASLRKTKGVQIAPGEYSVMLDWVGSAAETLNVRIEAGKLIELKPSAVTLTSPNPTPTDVVGSMGNPKALTSAPPPPANSEFDWRMAGQLSTALLGVGVGVFGLTEYGAGASSHDDLEIEQQNQEIRSRQELINWNQRNQDYTDRANLGLFYTAVGTSLVLTSTVWWLLSKTQSNELSLNAPANADTPFTVGSF